MEPVVVETESGAVAGERLADGLAVFRGIPYAAPPVGPLRFRAPQPLAPWQGAREATAFAPMSLQPPPDAASSIPGDPSEHSEDCLYLNVYTPSCDGARRPVMVWIHGGGFTSGSATSALYAAERLAGHGVVIVSVNYRLGALGWLAHPSLADDDDPASGYGNWGLRDQIAALEWVQANVVSFGGDPANVTVFGESAGGMSVAALLATSAPRRKLFSKAIIESGAAAAIGVGTATGVAEALAVELGWGEITRAGLEAIPAEELLRAQIAVGPRYEILGLPFQPVIDAGLLTDHPAALIEAGSAAGVKVLVGTNRDEWRFWTLGSPELRELTEDRLGHLVQRSIDQAGLEGAVQPREIIDTYRDARAARGESTTPSDVHSAISSDWVFRVPSMRLAGSVGAGFDGVFAYLFDWESPFGDGVLGSCHALELPFVFGTCANPFVAVFSGGGDTAEQLSLAMRSAWVAFATTGDPSCDEAGEWPPYDVARRATKRFGPVVDVVEAPMESERACLDRAWGQFGKYERSVSERVRIPIGRPS